MPYVNLLLGFALIVNVVLASLVSLNIKDSNNRNFLTILLSFICWIFLELVNGVSNFSLEATLFLGKLTLLAGLPLGVFCLRMINGFLGRPSGWIYKIGLILLLSSIGLTLGTDLVVTQVLRQDMRLIYSFGAGYFPMVALVTIIPFTYGLGLLVFNLRGQPVGSSTSDLRWVFFGLSLTGIPIAIVTVFLPGLWGIYKYLVAGMMFSAVLASFIFYAMYFNDLFGIFLSRDRYELFAKIFDHTKEAILVTNQQQQIIEVNPAFEEITGFTKEEIYGKNPSLLSSGRHDKTFYDNIWASIKTQGYWQGEIWDRRKSGEIYPQNATITKLRAQAKSQDKYMAIFSDITKDKDSQKRLNQLAYFDALTGLANRSFSIQELNSKIKSTRRREMGLAVLFIDLDGFKAVNDSMGHKMGDEVLVSVANQFTAIARKSDLVCRQGGDEFLVIMSDLSEAQEATVLAMNLMEIFQNPFELSNGKAVFLNCSIGISYSPTDGENPDDLIRYADSAMYEAKKLGKGRFHFYSEDIEKRVVEQMSMDYKLHKAVENNQFVVFYQPQVDSTSGSVIGIESLVRWDHPEDGIVGPDQFIGLAEATGLIHEIGEFVLRESCAQLKFWQDQGMGNVVVSVNCSLVQFERGSLPQLVKNVLKETGLNPKYLKIEITESMMMDSTHKVVSQLSELRKLGVGISMDDFGTGYSSLNILQKIPLTDLKIDRAFITKISTNNLIAKLIIHLAAELGLVIIAEGAEEWEQVEILHQLGCHHIQGFFYSKALNSKDLEKFIKFQNLKKI
ncbi:MAG: EAL domain-containing protein [SAR324 cluster bacterium]|nr:EAL domain-containing protein [SAR324 cluster bacterium]